MRVALYARVSTDDKGQNPETQLHHLRADVQRREWQIVDEYVDLGWSGAKDRRPQLDRLMKDAAKRKFDVVMVWRYDRFARSTLHLIRACDTFESLGINFVSLHEATDTTTAMGRFVFRLFANLAELERDVIRERVKAGMARAKAQGVKFGRPTVLVNRGRICELAEAGRPIAEIARGAGISRSTVRAIIGGKAKATGGETPISAAL
jgi:DNA invertase Pin-like site-specific DNA recombinase